MEYCRQCRREVGRPDTGTTISLSQENENLQCEEVSIVSFMECHHRRQYPRQLPFGTRQLRYTLPIVGEDSFHFVSREGQSHCIKRVLHVPGAMKTSCRPRLHICKLHLQDRTDLKHLFHLSGQRQHRRRKPSREQFIQLQLARQRCLHAPFVACMPGH